MCGPPRPSSGHRIAIIFPPQSETHSKVPRNPYSLFFRETPAATAATTAIFRAKDTGTLDVLRACRGIELRIEKHGDLSTPLPLVKEIPPLHRFRLRPSPSLLTGPECPETLEFDLPEKLDLGVSETGIVGRQVTIVVEGVDRDIHMGKGIIGYD